MKPGSESNSFTIPPALLAEVEAAAEEEHRPVADVVREALERYLAEWRKSVNLAQTGRTPAKLSPAEAVERLLEQRKDNVLPDGVTIRQLMTYGRA
jgi:Ribbon-helix-helix protein, copG family